MPSDRSDSAAAANETDAAANETDAAANETAVAANEIDAAIDLDPAVNEMVEGPGEALNAAREALGISCREVSEALNLPLRVVEAIESNDFENLPGAVFTRGYIRAYAKLLELDADSIVARYSEPHVDEPNRESRSPNGIQNFVRTHPQWALGGGAIVLLAVLGIIIYGVWVLFDSSDEKPVEQVTAQRTEPQAVASPVVALVQDDSEDLGGHTTGQLNTGTAFVQAERTTADISTATEVVSGETAEITISASSVRRISATGDDELWFSFSDECWVEVLSTSGENLYSDLSRSGDTLELVGSGPFRILLGYAPGVRMAFNGEPVVLGPHTRNNVANLVLGQ